MVFCNKGLASRVLHKAYEVLLDSQPINEKKTSKSASLNFNQPNEKHFKNELTNILMLGSTGSTGTLVLKSLVDPLFHQKCHAFSSACRFNKIINVFCLNRSAHPFLKDFEEINKRIVVTKSQKIKIREGIEVDVECRTIKCATDLQLNLIEIIFAKSFTWPFLLESLFTDNHFDKNERLISLPPMHEMHTLVSALGATSASANKDHVEQSKIDYELNYQICKVFMQAGKYSTEKNVEKKIVLITSFNSNVLKKVSLYFENKWNLEKDVYQNLKPSEMVAIRPGPLVNKHATFEQRDCKKRASHFIASFMYQTQLADLVGHPCLINNVALATAFEALKPPSGVRQQVKYIKSSEIEDFADAFAFVMSTRY